MQVLITWECTIAHAIPWDTFFPWIQKDTDKARFVSAISKASIEHEHKLQRTGWIACDPLAVAVAIRPELIEEAEVFCCASNSDNHTTSSWPLQCQPAREMGQGLFEHARPYCTP